MGLDKLIKAEDSKYISVDTFISLVANHTSDSLDEVISYVGRYCSITEHDMSVYMKDGFSGYFSEFRLSDLLIKQDYTNDYRLYKISELRADSEFAISYFLKDDIFNASFIKSLNLKPSSINITNINNLISKAPPPPNHIKTTKSFNQSTPSTIGDLIKSQKQEKVILPNQYQRITMLYDYFTLHEAACFIAGLHPNFNGCDDGLEMGNSVVRGGAKSGKLITDDDGQIKSDDLKLFLHSKDWVIKGFNDNLLNHTDKIPAPTITQTEPPNNDQLIKELAAAKAQITDLEDQLAQAKADLADKPADSITQSNTDIHNIKKEAIKQFNRSLATVLIKLDYKDKLRKGDIANYILPYMKELAFVLADEQQDKANNLTVTYDTLYDNHLKNLGFKQGRQSDDEKQKVNIDLLFKKQLPITE